MFVASFAAGIGFLAGLLLLGYASYFGFEKSQDWQEESSTSHIIPYPNDIEFASHSAVTLKRKLSIAGELSFENREKYMRIFLRALVFDGERFLMECSDSKFTEDAHDYFEIGCDIENARLPENVRYDIEVYQAYLSD